MAMSKSALWIGGFICVAVAGGALYFWQNPPKPNPDSAFLAACEETLKKRLKAPSTYNRVEIQWANELISSDPEQLEKEVADLKDLMDQAESEIQAATYEVQMLEKELELITARMSKKMGTNGKYFRAFISYDADNSYGTPLRSLVECEFTSFEQEFRVIYNDAVRVNGETHHDWIMSGLRN